MAKIRQRLKRIWFLQNIAVNGELVPSSILRTVMLCVDLNKAYLLAGGPEWIRICGGLTLSQRLPRMLMGSEGRNE